MIRLGWRSAATRRARRACNRKRPSLLRRQAARGQRTPSDRAASARTGAVLARWPAYLACEDDGDGDGCGRLDRRSPGGVLPAPLVGAGDERPAELDGLGDRAGAVGDPDCALPPAVPGSWAPALWLAVP